MTVAGDLNQRIYLQRRDTALGALREQSKAWVMYTPNGLWAKVYTPRGREIFAAGQEQAQSTIVFRIRHRTDVTTKMRLLWREQPYDIAAVNPVQAANEWIDLMCNAGIGDGRMT